MLVVIGVGLSALWFLIWRRHAKEIAGLSEKQAKKAPSFEHIEGRDVDDEEHLNTSYQELITDEVEGGEDDGHGRALFIGSMLNTDKWWRIFYRTEPLSFSLLVLTLLALLVSLLAVAAGGHTIYFVWVFAILGAWLLVPAYWIIRHFHAIYSRRVHSYLFYNGKLVVLRANGVMTQYFLDSNTTHESTVEKCFFFTCNPDMTRITTFSQSLTNPLVIHVRNDDKALFVRYLYYAREENPPEPSFDPATATAFNHPEHSPERQATHEWLDSAEDDDGGLDVVPEARERDWLDED